MCSFKKLLVCNLRFHRNKHKLSQAKMAELINISTTYYNAIENGKYFPSVDTLERICNIFNIFPYQLFLENPAACEEQQIFPSSESILTDLSTILKKYCN